ncbi:MarC family protein, partial [Novosphingobium sp. TCA1]|uniref:MarC family protein n=1 Tax=Novosphingobium sp. TCA1 TaxID=2682474 RepID=UPI00135CED6C
ILESAMPLQGKLLFPQPVKAAVLATIVGLIIIFIGDNMREKWGIEREDLLVTGGLLLLIGALDSIKSAQHPHEKEAPPQSPDGLALSPVTFPIIITPYGIVALLLFAAVAGNTQTFVMGVFAIFLGMMIADYLAMIFSGPILRFVRPGSLMAFGWLVSVLQAALAVHAILSGLRAVNAVDVAI